MPNVYSHPGWWRQDGTPPPPPPTDMDLDQRVSKLEDFALDTRERLIRIEARLDGFSTTFSTKEDLARVEGSIRSDMHKEFTAQTWRIIGAMLTFGTALVAAVYFIARNVR